VLVHHRGHRWKKRVGPDKGAALEVARGMQRRLAAGEFDAGKPQPEAPVPFGEFAARWLRTEVELPIERGLGDRLAPGTAEVYRMQVDVHLRPWFRERDVRAIGAADVQGFYDCCLETGRPRSAKSIEMALGVLRLILSHARAQGIVKQNAVEDWRRGRRRGRRRGSASLRVEASKVLGVAQVGSLLDVLAQDAPRYWALCLFMADTGSRFGEAAALRWIDVDLDGGTARIARSYSSGKHLGPTKTGRERIVELSTRVREALAARRPAILSDEALVFPNRSGGFLLDVYFRNKVFYPAVRKAFGPGLHFSPHCLRHTWASLHMARGTPLKWIQEQGGWTTAKLLLDTYGHFMPTESRGFADALTAQNAPPAHPRPIAAPARLAKSAAKAGGYAPATAPRSPIMHFTEPPPFLRNSETSTVSGVTPRSRTWVSRRSETPAGITRKHSFPRARWKEFAA
jgi:integrase